MPTSKPKTPATRPTEFHGDALDKVAGGRKAGACQPEVLLPPPPKV